MSKKNRSLWRKSDAPSAQSTSAAQLGANQANAQLSTGPRTEMGRATSWLNAVKTGLTGNTVLLPTDDVAAYEEHMLCYKSDFAPVCQRETHLVESIAQTAWRLKRIPLLEYSIYAVGHQELAEQFAHENESVRNSIIQFAVHIKYEKQIRNLQLQESRLVRRREKELAELRQLQTERKETESSKPASIAEHNPAPMDNSHVPPNGFEFSTSAQPSFATDSALTAAPLGHSKAA